MTRYFADTFYWVALLNPKDSWHQRVLAFSQTAVAGPQRLYTTDEALAEFLTFYSQAGPHIRQQAAQLVRDILADPDITVVPQSRSTFLAALDLYEARSDKGYSLPDCNSMVVMKHEGLTEVLSNDQHFAQEGFQLVFQEYD